MTGQLRRVTPDVTHDYVKEYFDYHEDGYLTVKKYRRGGCSVGRPVCRIMKPKGCRRRVLEVI